MQSPKRCTLCKNKMTDNVHKRWVYCHHGMARPQVADGGDALQAWRVAANILNEQSRATFKGWSFSLNVGRGDNNSSPKKINSLRKITRNLRPGRIPWISDQNNNNNNKNSVVLVRKRTIPIERSPPVSEASANFSG
jgi:hypothetical protein